MADIENTTFYNGDGGYLNIQTYGPQRRKGKLVHLSAWKVDKVVPNDSFWGLPSYSYGDQVTINTYDDGNDDLPKGHTWKVIGSDHGQGKLLIERM